MATSLLRVELLSQGLFHSLVAALFVEALVRSWDVTHPGQRAALRLVALGYPLLVFPALVLLFPQRGDEAFRDAALLSGRRWSDVPFLGLDLHLLFTGALAGLGLVLLAIDVGTLLRALGRGRPVPAEPGAAHAAALEAALAPLAAAGGTTGAGGGGLTRAGVRPPVAYLDRPLPSLFCAGLRHPTIYVTRGAVELLDAGELQAALAHELAHLDRRDPGRSWVMLGLRCLMGWNPTFQVLARALARDAERLADERGAALGADRLALASALLKLHRASGGTEARRTLLFGGALAGTVRRARSHDLERRVRELLRPPPRKLPFGGLRLGLALTSLTGLLWFVT